jgi:rubrerythrin
MTIDQDIKRRMCFEKKDYKTEQQANKIKKHAEAKRDVKLRVYQCPICGFWHLTSKSEDEYASV